jgi:hypothetical protein
MASTGQNYIDQLTVNNQGITDLKELLFLTVLQDGSITETVDFVTGAKQGSRLGGIGELEPVGKPSNGCEPVWNASKLTTQEKVWNLGAYEIAETICYSDLENTIAQWALNTGTDGAEVISKFYYTGILEPTLKIAIEKMLWRLVWLGDLEAKNVTDGGVITNGVSPDLFKINDGLFKRLLTITTTAPLQRVNIAANTLTTYADQLEGIRTQGTATAIFDKIIYNAPMKLRQKSDKILLVTQTLADALSMDVKANNKGSDLQWRSLFNGFVSATEHNGQTILSLPIWDDMIQSFENTGTSWNKPHRAVFAPKSTLKAGTESNDMIADLQAFFVQKDQKNYMLAKDKIGTLTWEDDLIVYAY